MANNLSPLEQLRKFLNEIFQFESQDLDFGIYKILNYKRKEIRDFIDKLLVEKVKEQLQILSDDESKKILRELKELEKDDIISGWLKADEEEKKTLEKFGKDKINRYGDLITKSKDLKVSEETENLLFNHLTQFFSRYYDKGDFISKRRFVEKMKNMLSPTMAKKHIFTGQIMTNIILNPLKHFSTMLLR